jgi:hypothetical protein
MYLLKNCHIHIDHQDCSRVVRHVILSLVDILNISKQSSLKELCLGTIAD